MSCINLYTNFLFVIIWLHFDFSNCLLLAKSLIIWCSKIISDLGYAQLDISLFKYLKIYHGDFKISKTEKLVKDCLENFDGLPLWSVRLRFGFNR